MAESKLLLSKCLFFTAAALARQMQEMAQECFVPTGLNPSQGFALLCVIDEPGVQPSVIAERLALAPSTVTRIIDALRKKGLVESEADGRTSLLTATTAGKRMATRVRKAWKDLYHAYSERLGQPVADQLCANIHECNLQLADTEERISA